MTTLMMAKSISTILLKKFRKIASDRIRELFFLYKTLMLTWNQLPDRLTDFMAII